MSSEQFLKTLQKLLDDGKFDKVRQGCKDLLAREPNNLDAQRLLDEATRRKATLEKGAASVKVTALSCPNCSSSLSPREDSQALVCAACGSVLDLTKAVGQKCDTMNFGANPPLSFLRLGLEGTIFGKRVQIIGRIRYRCTMKEWDEEDNCYTRGTWVYDEWQLVTEDKGYIFIEEDSEGYRLFQKFTPNLSQMPEEEAEFIALEQSVGRLRVMERGTASVNFFEGEFTWVPKSGDSSRYVDIGTDNPLYAIEWRLERGSSDKVEEVEFYRGRTSNRIELLECFGQKAELEKAVAERRSDLEYKVWGWSYFALSLFLLVMAWNTRGDGTRIFEKSISLNEIPAEGRLVGPIELKQVNTVYNLNLVSSIPTNSAAWGAVELLDSDYASINAVEGDFWSETGYDDEGSWAESDLSSNYYFRLEKPGTYYARFFVEKETASTGTLSLRVYEGVLLSRYFLVGGLFALGMAVAIGRFKKLNPLFAAVGLVVLGYLILTKLSELSDD